MKRVVLGLVGACALFFAGRMLYRALASHETKIRWRIESMVDGFNRTRPRPVLRGFRDDYRDESSDADRELVHSALVSLFFTEKDPETKAFTLRADVPRETLVIEVAEDAQTATAEGVLTIYERLGEAEELLWSAGFEGDLTHGEDGWVFVRSRHSTQDGERPR